MFTWRHWFYLLGSVAFGFGVGIVAGLFPEDAAGTEETPTGKVHGIGSGLGFMLLLLTPLWAQGMPELAAVTTWNAAGFSIALFALILFLISGKRSGHHRGLTRLWQRLSLAALYGVLLITGLASWVVS